MSRAGDAQGPVLFSGVGMSLPPDSQLVRLANRKPGFMALVVANGQLTSFACGCTAGVSSTQRRADSILCCAQGKPLAETPALAGPDLTLVALSQLHNNARVAVAGSMKLFGNGLFHAPVDGRCVPQLCRRHSFGARTVRSSTWLAVIGLAMCCQNRCHSKFAAAGWHPHRNLPQGMPSQAATQTKQSERQCLSADADQTMPRPTLTLCRVSACEQRRAIGQRGLLRGHQRLGVPRARHAGGQQPAAPSRGRHRQAAKRLSHKRQGHLLDRHQGAA